MLGNSSASASAASVKLVLQLPVTPGLENADVDVAASLTAVYPGGKTVSIGPATPVAGGCDWKYDADGCAAFELTVPLVRGCALVSVKLQSV